MDKFCFIVEDLLPLYNEKLLSDETNKWVEDHLKECENCRQLAGLSGRTLTESKIESPINNEEMFKKINRKISIYQIIFIALSFFFAIKTSVLNQSFGFILWYAVLGTITYLFYKDMRITFIISFIPLFIWSIANSMVDFFGGHVAAGVTLWEYIFSALQGALFISLIHYLFALLGSVVGVLIIKIKE